MKRLIFAVIALWASLDVACAFAYLTEQDLKILRGLKGVRVEVERLKPEIERDGLYGSTLQTEVELKLRVVGMKILTAEEGLKSPGAPCIYLHVDAFKHRKGYVYRIQLSLKEEVSSVRKRTRVVASTFRIPQQFGITRSLSDIIEVTDGIVDEFTKAWIQANPP